MIIPLKKILNSSVFLRVDFNVPLEKNQNGEFLIKDSTRIEKSLPTILKLLENQNKIILASHLGRPKGLVNPELSLQPVFNEFSKIIKGLFPGIKLVFCENFEKLEENFQKDFQILFFENLRFWPDEEKNNQNFKEKFKKLTKFFVNDAFSCCHRAHASIMLSREYDSNHKTYGILLEKEIENINKFFDSKNNKKKLAIIGGSKISTKIKLIKTLEKKFDYIFLGGAMANIIFSLLGFEIGLSLKEELSDDLKKDIVSCVSSSKIILPDDFVCVESEIQENSEIFIKKKNEIEKEDIMLDIGPKSISKLKALIGEAEFVNWNGPLGFFENNNFIKGTKEIAEHIAFKTKEGKIQSIIGGGDSVSAINKFKIPFESFSYVSTSGGAFLEYIENDLNLIGLEEFN